MTQKGETGRISAAPFYDRISAAYELIADAAEHEARERGLDVLAVNPGEQVLEIGAGTGRALERLAREAGPRGRVCGLDVSSGMLSIARQRVSEAPGQVSLQRGDGRDLPFRNLSFDAVFLSFTLELFEPPDIGLVLAEAARVLRPAGRLGVVSLEATREPGLVSQAYVWLHRHFPHFIDCQPIDIRGHLARGGFRVARIEERTLWGLPVAAVLGELARPNAQS